MAGKNGIYILYRKSVNEDGTESINPVGRFALHGGNISVLEDRDGLVESIFPPGPMTSRELMRMHQMEDGRNPYLELVLEQDIQEGHRDDLVEELNLGGSEWPKPDGE